jgi:DNA (cytosine-5)-methyltransferase 1
MLVHYDLFAGIGGFSLAVDEVFADVSITHVFAEWEAFPTAVLKRHWPDGLYYGDIADLVADSASDADEGTGEATASPNITNHPRLERLRDLLRQNAPSILTGGFPCQPFSVSGQQRGTSDDRYQWPAMYAAIQHIQPTWIIAENVPGLASWQSGVVLEHICTDLESEGYVVQPLLIPACAVNAPHRRERLWILACQTPTNTARVRGQKRQRAVRPHPRRSEPPDDQRRGERLAEATQVWDQDWQSVAAELCGLDDGLPVALDGSRLSAARSRQEQLKAYGNAIVPQVAVRIVEAIRESGFMPPATVPDLHV